MQYSCKPPLLSLPDVHMPLSMRGLFFKNRLFFRFRLVMGRNYWKNSYHILPNDGLFVR